MRSGKYVLDIPNDAEIEQNAIEIPSPKGAVTSEAANFFVYQSQFMKFAVGDHFNACKFRDGAFLHLTE